MTQRRWLVTGCSSGLGRALAQALAAAGEQVLATARRKETLSGLDGLTAVLDVRDPEQCQAAVDLAVERFGGLDVLVNNAGYGQFGAVEELSDVEVADQFATNVFGPWRLTRLILPHMRAQGSGHIIFTSSLSGTIAFPGLAAYTASKFALEGMAESLAQEGGPLGIKVTILQLGGFATDYGRKAIDPNVHIAAYEPMLAEMLTMVRAVGDNPDSTAPEQFAARMLQLSKEDGTPLRLPFGEGAFDYLDAAMTSRREEFERARAAAQP